MCINWSTPKHKLEKWFIISGDGVRTYVQNTPIKELNHFSSKCFGWYFGWIIVRLKCCISILFFCYVIPNTFRNIFRKLAIFCIVLGIHTCILYIVLAHFSQSIVYLYCNTNSKIFYPGLIIIMDSGNSSFFSIQWRKPGNRPTIRVAICFIFATMFNTYIQVMIPLSLSRCRKLKCDVTKPTE